MKNPVKPSKKDITVELEQQNGELLLDLQRTRADFENYRKNVEVDKARVKQVAEESMVAKILPVLDDLDLATAHAPVELADNAWVKGVLNLNKKLETELGRIGVVRISSQLGEDFNPEWHEAVLVEDGDGEREVIAEVLRTGYLYNGQVLRPSVVKVKRQ